MKIFHILAACAVVVLVGAVSTMYRLQPIVPVARPTPPSIAVRVPVSPSSSVKSPAPSPPVGGRSIDKRRSLPPTTLDDDGSSSSANDEAATRAPASGSPGCGAWCTDVCGDIKADELVKDSDVPSDVRDYVARHVLFAFVTGSFERFFRIDIALCTWLRHVPASNYVVVTDNATRATAGVAGSPAAHRTRVTWVEGVLPPGVKFSRRQVEAKGYTLGWIKAQFRFVQGLEALASIAELPGHDAHDFDEASVQRNRDAVRARPGFDPRWLIVLDDDTFTSLPALVRMLRGYDRSLCGKAAAAAAASRGATAAGERKPLGVPDEAAGEDATDSPMEADGNAKDAATDVPGDASRPLKEKDRCQIPPHRWRPTYLGEHGWGGAGHIFSYSAAVRFLGAGYEPCVERNMIQKFYASDVALKKCMPGAGITTTSESRLSHCQATFLRERMLSGRHVSSHVKRELDKHPRFFALWRLRLYYQVMYQANRTAYRTLMDVGACAYGSCKIGKCRKEHDDASAARFVEVSRNNTLLPLS